MKSKTTEMNDIIDSSYTEPDYSYGNGYYDEVNDYRRKTSNTNEPATTNSFSKISITRAHVTSSASMPNTSTSNMFMKYSGAGTNTNTNAENIDKPIVTPNEIKNIEDEFPSLGGGGGNKKPIAQKMQVPMNFKKIVETKKPVEVMPQVVQAKPKHDDYYNRFKVYEDVKYYSEKTARSKIYNGSYSDDDNDDNDDNGNYDDDDD